MLIMWKGSSIFPRMIEALDLKIQMHSIRVPDEVGENQILIGIMKSQYLNIECMGDELNQKIQMHSIHLTSEAAKQGCMGKKERSKIQGLEFYSPGQGRTGIRFSRGLRRRTEVGPKFFIDLADGLGNFITHA